ncbi:MAG: transglutaminase domain-containing protein [Planctomycetota bacterium]
MAIIGLASVMPLRAFVEDWPFFVAELLAMGLLAVAAVVAKPDSTMRYAAPWLVPVPPLVFALITRRFATPIAFEMTLLTMFGAAAVALVCADVSQRLRSMAMILSGFLVLFSASISDSDIAIVFPVVWILICVWHLIANDWERLDLAMPESVQRTWTLRPSSLLVTLLAVAVGGFVVKDRFGPSRQLDFGIMPTSGGTRWSDPAARGGVGTGDLAIAAQDHAESFGAVDSEIFLESNESTLFDMFNDMLGEPKKRKNKWERRQGMANQNVIPMHEQASRSERGGGNFSTERMPAPKHRHFKNVTEASVIQWDGPTGIRLGMHRYDTFDGTDWSQSEDLASDKLWTWKINGDVWFFDPAMQYALLLPTESTSVGLLRVIRLDTTRIPTPAMTAGIHIKELDRADFFALADDGSFDMPGREKIPPLTVIHMASVILSEDDIRSGLKAAPAPQASLQRDEVDASNDSVESLIKGIVELAGQQHSDPYDQLTACIDHMRQNWTFDRGSPGDEDSSSATGNLSLIKFLRSHRGGDHLFATTAALIARELGLSSRLVTGFYVRPDAFEMSAQHACVLPSDVHVWAEVGLTDGRWFEIEATPGYKPPDYRPSWGLLAKQFAAAYWPSIAIFAVTIAAAFRLRRIWVDWLLTLMWRGAIGLGPRRQVRLAMKIIETRARLAGHRRPAGTTQRAWLEMITRGDAAISAAAAQFSNAADALCFGEGNPSNNESMTHLVDLLRVPTITRLTNEAVS